MSRFRVYVLLEVTHQLVITRGVGRTRGYEVHKAACAQKLGAKCGVTDFVPSICNKRLSQPYSTIDAAGASNLKHYVLTLMGILK
jgi:hypothetical protein